MVDDIKVRGSTYPTAVKIAVEKIGDTYYPIYKLAVGEEGEATLMGKDAPVSVESIRLYDLTRDIRDTNLEILKQLKLMNSHFSEWDGNEDGDL